MRMISAYSAIKLLPRCLVVFDIDDTVLHFPSHDRAWWKNTKANYMITQDMDDPSAEHQTLLDWRAGVSTLDALPINKEEFHQFYNDAAIQQCDLIFLTARDSSMKEVTYNHVRNSLLPTVHDQQIYFSEHKGPALKHILQTNYPQHKHVIFIDDYEKNHQSVLATFQDDPNITLDVYHFVHQHHL